MVDKINRFVRHVPVWAVWVLYLLPVPVLLYMGMTGGLGREPIKALEHELGEIALQLLIIGLSITPLRRYLGVNLLKFRRAFGLLAFTYVALHLLVWAVLDVQIIGQMWADIVKRPYITIGMAALLVMVPLAITSNNRSVRRLGPKWRQLHKLTYIAVILGGVHFLMVRRGFQLEPIIYLIVIFGLLALRIPRKRLMSSLS
ncbi:MAG: protein-methionine-sulfoxide reductase heme-binding subunit MsrQ [Paracoccaceae bacterium]